MRTPTFEVRGIHSIDKDYELRVWHVASNRRERSFQTLIDVTPYELPQGGLRMRDLAGDLFVIPDPDAPDGRSRSLLRLMVSEGLIRRPCVWLMAIGMHEFSGIQSSDARC
ncbi:MAG: DUF1854 domain-containing protein [Opitutales bacterium]